MRFEEMLAEDIAELKRKSLYRTLRYLRPISASKFLFEGRIIVNAASNNYLGLTHSREVVEEAKKVLEEYGAGSGASRLVSGTFDIHDILEKEIAEIKDCSRSLVFPSGYSTNVGTISAMVGRGDVIFSDRLNHASIIDGCRLSRADVVVYKHCDMYDLEKKLGMRDEYRRAMIVTDSVFSVDGDVAPLRELRKLADEFSCILMVDEAHATGVFGEKGGGVCEAAGVKADVNMGTLSKALASQGGFVAGSDVLIEYLVNKARSFIYSTSLSPPCVASAVAAVRIMRRGELRKKLWENVEMLRDGLEDLNFDIVSGDSHITAVLIGDESKGVRFSELLLKNGVYCPVLRYPTVEVGKSRVRVSVTASHTPDDIEKILFAFRKAGKEVMDRGV